MSKRLFRGEQIKLKNRRVALFDLGDGFYLIRFKILGERWRDIIKTDVMISAEAADALLDLLIEAKNRANQKEKVIDLASMAAMVGRRIL